MEENNVEKKNNTLVYALVVLIVILLGVCGYFAYDKYFANKPVTPPNNDKIPEKQEEPTNDSKAEIEVKNNISFDENIVKEAKELLDEKLRGLAYIYFKKGKINDLADTTKIWIAIETLTGDLEEFQKYKSDEILKKLRDIFGSNFTINFKDIKWEDNIVLKFNKETQKYIYDQDHGGFGLGTFELVKEKLVDYQEKDGKYIISYKQLFGVPDNSEYDEIQYSNFSGDVVFTRKYAEDEDFEDIMPVSDEEFAKYEDKIETVSYIFEKENGHLVLKEIK